MTNPNKLLRGVFLALALTLGTPMVGAGLPVLGVADAQAQSQRLIAAVLFEGNQAFSDAALLDMVNAAESGVYTEAGLAADVETIRLAYDGKGFEGVSVTTRVENADNGRTRVVFVINEGERTGIAAINFTGNNSIASGTLKSVIRTKETGLLSWLFRDDAFNEDQLIVDRGLIELYYMNHGYPDATVTSAVGEYDAARNAYFVNFTINEGQRYQFGEVSVESSIPEINTGMLASTIRTQRGETYSLAELSRTQEDMALEATSQGFAFADVRPRIDRDAANATFNVTYLVDQGARIYIERINITGNEKTRDAVIRREMDFGEGDPYNRSIVQRAKSSIENLGFFSSVTIDTAPGSAPDKVTLNVAVVEQSTGEYGLSAGYASDSGLLGEVSVTERNFLGRGQYVKASISASQSGQSYDFSFTEPRFMGLKMSAGFDVYHRISAESSSYMYGTTATGGQIRFGVPVTRDVNFSVFTGVETKTVEDAKSPFSEVLLESGELPGDADGKVFNKAWVGYTLAYSGVDNTKNPTEGLVASWTTQYIGWDFNLVKSEAKARYFMPLLADANIIGSVRGQAGIVTSLDGDAVSPLEAFKMSSTLVRGFQSGSLGPKYATGGGTGPNEALGYTAYALASAEIEFPIPVIPETYGLRGAVWADAAVIDGQGTDLPANPGSIDDNLKASVGVSVIWDSPFGPLRGDFAHVLNKATEDKTQVFQLSIQQLL